jgi:MFS family permease
MTTDEQRADFADDRYKWVALINTTLGVLVVTINSSIVIISLPAIFRGIGLNPLQPANVSYLLWILLGFLVVTSVLVVSFGRLGDSYGRVRLYNLGFAIFTACSIGLSLIFAKGSAAAMAIIVLRVVQGVGGAMIFANAAAILTDAFPANQRGMALGINSVAAVAGSFIGLIIGGLLASANWHLVFLVSVPIGLFGTIWGYARLREVSTAQGGRMDWWGSVLFAVGLVAVLVGLTYGIQPYGGHPMGWTSPAVLGSVIGGVLILGIFVLVERRVAEPMLDFALLLRNRTFASGNLASLLSSIGRGGLLFALIIWLQGIWLPLRGYSFERTPLWSAIFMLPLTAGFLIAGPLAGIWSDRLGPRPFAVGGQLTGTIAFVLLAVLPVNFQYWAFALLLLAFGLGMGAFSSSNAAEVMGAVDPAQRGSAAGIRATALNCGQTLAISLFFSLLTAGLAARLPHALSSGLAGAGVPAPQAAAVAHLPPVAMLFATFLGYNPIQSLLGPALHSMPAATARTVTSTAFFPHVISGPFHDALQLTFGVAAALMLLATVACTLTRPRPAGAVAQAPGAPRLGTRADETDALAAEAGRLEAQVRHWQQLAMAEGAAVPLVITVSAPLGAGGDQVAQRLAGQLNLPFVDRAIPAAVAEQLSVPLASAQAHDERRESGALRLLVSAANTEPLFGLEVAAIDFDDEDQFRLATEASLWKLAATSGGVILGRVGAVILAGHPRAIHVRVTASRATRCRRVHEYGGLDEPAALRLIDRTDRARAEYARHLYGADLSDPGLYDLIVATDKLSIDDAAEVVTAFLAVSGLQAPGTSSGRSTTARPG